MRNPDPGTFQRLTVYSTAFVFHIFCRLACPPLKGAQRLTERGDRGHLLIEVFEHRVASTNDAGEAHGHGGPGTSAPRDRARDLPQSARASGVRRPPLLFLSLATSLLQCRLAGTLQSSRFLIATYLVIQIMTADENLVLVAPRPVRLAAPTPFYPPSILHRPQAINAFRFASPSSDALERLKLTDDSADEDLKSEPPAPSERDRPVSPRASPR